MDFTDTGHSMNADYEPGATPAPGLLNDSSVIQAGANAFNTANTIWQANNAFNAEQANQQQNYQYKLHLQQ